MTLGEILQLQNQTLGDFSSAAYPQQGFQLPPGWLEWLLRNWQMMGSTRPEYTPGAEDRTVGPQEMYQLKIPAWQPNPEYGVDKMRIPQEKLQKRLKRVSDPNRLRKI